MRLLFVGDLHFRAKKLSDISSAWKGVVGWAKRNSIDGIVQAGDVFSHFNVYGREASTGTIYDALLEPLCSDGKPLPLLTFPGNHDIGAPRDKDALAPIERHPWVTVVRTPKTVQFGEVSVCVIPWIYRIHLVSKLEEKGLTLSEATKKVEAAIRSIPGKLAAEAAEAKKNGKFVILAGHCDIAGSKLHNGYRATGSFEFSPEEIASVGADAYAFGHIHVRQHVPRLPSENDGYLGTLCQLDFGEEGNSVGCRLLETSGRNLVADKWMENKTSPRYFTVSDSLSGLSYRQGTDRVKLRGTTRPESLPEGIQFEPLPREKEKDERKHSSLSVDSPLSLLLSAWAEESGCKIPVDQLEAAALKLAGISQVLAESIGSFDRIKRIVLKNITKHSDTDIVVWDAPIIAVCGPNGTGKTTAMEAFTVCLYGITSKPSLASLLPSFLEECESAIEMEFDSGGKPYLARREFKKGGKAFHKAFVFDMSTGTPVPLAGPKIEDVTSFSTRLVGDPALVLAGMFSPQGDADNLVKLRPAPRKDLFAKMLGSDRFFAISEEAKRACSADGAIIDANKARIEGLRLELASEDADSAELARLRLVASGKKKDAEDARTATDALREAAGKLEAKKKDRDSALAGQAALLSKKKAIVDEGKRLKEERSRLASLDPAAALKALSVAKEKHKAHAVLADAAKTASLVSEQAKGESVRAAAALSNAKAHRASAYSAYACEIVNRKDAAREERNAARLPLQQVAEDERLRAQLAATRAEDAKRRAETVASIPGLKECKECPLAKSGMEAKESVADLRVQATAAARKEIAAAKALEDFDKEVLSMLGAFVPVPEPEWHPDLLKAIADLEKKVAASNSKATSEVESAKALSIKVETSKTLLGPLEALEKALSDASAAQANISKFEALLKAKKAEYDGIEKELRLLVIPAYDEASMTGLQAQLAEAKNAATAAEHAMSFADLAAGRQEAKVEQHGKRKTEIARIEAENASKEGFVSVHQALTKAFSRDGIPQLVADSAIPHLEELMRELIAECEARWSIRIATQRETKSGTVQERIDILVDDGDGERDISTYSGGELNLLSVVVRIAFSMLQAERSGKGLKVIVLDETMYFADEANSDSFMRMVSKLAGRFNQVFLVSHKDYVLSAIPDKMVFSLGSDGRTKVRCERSGK